VSSTRVLSSSSLQRIAVSQNRCFVSSRSALSADTRLCKDELEAPSKKVLSLADEVVALNLLEINQLMRYLQVRVI
jgi:hypothetical protein